jgi:membrane-bound ClpP family serine protease
MIGSVVRSGARWGLLLLGAHLVLSVPFLFLGPMLTSAGSGHGGIIGWIWFVLEFPAFAMFATLRLDRVPIFPGAVLGAYASFIVWASGCWFLIGFVVSFVVGRWPFPRKRARHGSDQSRADLL